jgi:signal transduction histidine kinase
MALAEDLTLLETVAGQLALLLDGTALLERVVAVERSLAQAEKLAAIGETAARIAHDIRNPVTAARSLAQQLAREPAAPFREELGVILEELDRVERQVATLLRFARREEFRFEPLDLGALARTTLESLRPRLEAASVSLELDAAAGVVARVDGEKMRQVLMNLIENALDALRAAAGPRRLMVAVTGADGTARLHVSDTGPGVPPEALPRLFEPFFSLKTTGTGLGLAIAKRTVDAHGGRITAASPPGIGLQIHVEVPLARAA